jgi:hypothetical protein
MDTPAPNRTLATRHDGLPPASNATAAPPLSAAGLAALPRRRRWPKRPRPQPRCAPTRRTGRIFRTGARRADLFPFPLRRKPSAHLASLANSHAPTTIRRQLSALGKMHRFNDLAWNPAHRDIQGPAAGLFSGPMGARCERPPP